MVQQHREQGWSGRDFRVRFNESLYEHLHIIVYMGRRLDTGLNSDFKLMVNGKWL